MYGIKDATKENILELITEYDIFKYYINNFNTLGFAFSSELTRDNKPSCCISLYQGKLKYTDFREEEKLNCFEYVMKKYSVNYYEALDIITNDFNLKLNFNSSKQVSSLLNKEIKLFGNEYLYQPIVQKEIKVELLDWNKTTHKRYWYDQYSISVKDLNYYDTFALKSFYIFNQNGWKHYISAPLSFGYYFDNTNNIEKWKIYQPYDDLKWLSNTDINIIQGFKQLKYQSDTLFITKALKDAIVLSKLGYESVAPNAELTGIPENIMTYLKSKYKRIIVLMDNDKVGMKGALKINKVYDLPFIFLPIEMAKDPSDYVAKFGYDSLKNQIVNLI